MYKTCYYTNYCNPASIIHFAFIKQAIHAITGFDTNRVPDFKDIIDTHVILDIKGGIPDKGVRVPVKQVSVKPCKIN